MGDLPLRTPTHRRLGGPSPRQQANAPHAHPAPIFSFQPQPMPDAVLWGIRPNFSGLSPCAGQVAYVLLTSAPVAIRLMQASAHAAPRLACVKPVASVHPEPGSNSSLYMLRFKRLLCFCSKSPLSVTPVDVIASSFLLQVVCPHAARLVAAAQGRREHFCSCTTILTIIIYRKHFKDLSCAFTTPNRQKPVF